MNGSPQEQIDELERRLVAIEKALKPTPEPEVKKRILKRGKK